MASFKAITTGHIVIMGRKTMESLEGRPLFGRDNIVITKKADDYHISGFKFKKNLAEALRYARQFPNKEIFVIGGQDLFRDAMPLADTIHLSMFKKSYDPTGENPRYFPQIPLTKWALVENTTYINYTKKTYHRIALDW
jgi:dihydrofolate reductase